MNQPTLNQPTTSVAAVVALVLTVLSLPGFLCCSPFGCATALIAIVCAGIGVFQFHTGSANTASGVMAWFSLLASAALVVGSVMMIGLAGMLSALEQHGIDVPSSGSDAPVERPVSPRQ